MNDLKEIYKASTQEAGYQNLEKLQSKWESKYPLAVKPWIVHWENVKTFFEFPWTFEAVGDLQWIHHKCECSSNCSFAYRHALT